MTAGTADDGDAARRVDELLDRLAGLVDPEIDPEVDPDPGDGVAAVLRELLDERTDDLVAALRGPDGVDIAEDLVSALSALVEVGSAAADGPVRRIAELVDRVGGAPGRVLLAGGLLNRAGQAAVAGDWPEARRWATWARPLLGPDVLEHGIPTCEHLLGRAAQQRGDRVLAEHHLMSALIGFWHRPAQAALVAWDLAELAENADAGKGDRNGAAERWWAAASDLLADAGDDESARGCGERACLLALTSLRSRSDDRDAADAFRRATAALALAQRRGLTGPAAELATAVAILSADQGLPWMTVAALFEANRVEIRGLPGSEPDRIALRVAATDWAEGRAALDRALVTAAEPPLRRALEAFDTRGRHDEATQVARQLRTVREFLRHGGSGPEVTRLVEQTVEAPLDDVRARLGGRALRAMRALQDGDPAPARQWVTDVDALQASPEPPSRSTAEGLGMIRQTLVTGLAQHTDGPSAATAELAVAVERALAAGAGLHAARFAAELGRRLLADRNVAAAVDALLPAVLALDAVRFELDGADRRRQWAAVVARTMDAAFRAVHTLGDRRLLAELLEVARANAVPAPIPAEGRAPALDELLDRASDTSSAPIAGTAVLAGEQSRTLLGRPARVRTPWGAIALEDQLVRARRYVDPVRADTVVDWLVGDWRTVHEEGP